MEAYHKLCYKRRQNLGVSFSVSWRSQKVLEDILEILFFVVIVYSWVVFLSFFVFFFFVFPLCIFIPSLKRYEKYPFILDYLNNICG